MSDAMQVIAQTLDSFLNGDGRGKIDERKIGFCVLVFPFGGAEGQRTNYVSNAERRDMIVALKEVLARWEGQPEIHGHA